MTASDYFMVVGAAYLARLVPEWMAYTLAVTHLALGVVILIFEALT